MANPVAPLTSLQAQLSGFILAELAFTLTRPLGPDTPLFEALLDSTSVLALVGHLEQEFQIAVEDHELVPANFATLRQLADFVERRAHPALNQRAANVS
ncbi:MAG: acyl carrier protein [Terriglobales bacterium]